MTWRRPAKDGKLYGRLAVNAAALFSRCNPLLNIEQVGSGGRIREYPQEEGAAKGGVKG